MEQIRNIVDSLETKLQKPVWYQKLACLDYNIGCGNLIFYKIRSGNIVWKLYQYV